MYINTDRRLTSSDEDINERASVEKKILPLHLDGAKTDGITFNLFLRDFV